MTQHRESWAPLLLAIIAIFLCFMLLWLTAKSHMRQHWAIYDLQHRVAELEQKK